MIVIPVFQLTWYKYENNRRQRLVEARNVPTVNSVPEFTDKTDFEQWETFRYTM